MRVHPEPLRPSIAEYASLATVVVAFAGAAVTASTIGWTVGTSLLLAIVVVAALTVAALFWRQRGRVRPLPSTPVVGASVVVALTLAGAAGTMWQRVDTGRVDDAERQQIAERAADITQLLITVTPESRAGYVDRLQRETVTGMPDIAKAEILDRIAEGDRQTGVIRATGVHDATGDQADVTVVVDRTGPQALSRDDGPPIQIILRLSLKNLDGQWKLASFAPAKAF